MTLEPRVRCDRGFSLIELLVVLLIMGVFVGLATVIARPDDRGLLRLEAERLAQLLDLAAEESRLTGKPIAWTADEGNYRFWRMTIDAGGTAQDTPQWLEIRDSDLLRTRTLPQGMRITGLKIENQPAREAARIEFAAYGSAPSFRIDLVLGTAHSAVLASPVGEIKVLADEGN